MKFYIADCFAEGKYQGNQLAVFIPDEVLSDGEMEQIAREIGFSETTFILSGKQEDGGYDVRIFTPDVEVPFAGHPVLGTAYILSHMLEKERTEQVLLNLKAGQIPVTIGKEGITMLQNEPIFGAMVPKDAAAKALSISAQDIRDDYPAQWVSTGLEAVIVPLKSVSALEKCRVNYEARQQFIDEYYKCNILVFAEDQDQLRVRVFMDDTGFLEDPATGSGNGDLAAYLLKHEYFGSHELQYSVSQGSEMGRPSRLSVKARLHDGHYTIQVGGHVHLVAEGNWY